MTTQVGIWAVSHKTEGQVWCSWDCNKLYNSLHFYKYKQTFIKLKRLMINFLYFNSALRENQMILWYGWDPNDCVHSFF